MVLLFKNKILQEMWYLFNFLKININSLDDLVDPDM